MIHFGRFLNNAYNSPYQAAPQVGPFQPPTHTPLPWVPPISNRPVGMGQGEFGRVLAGQYGDGGGQPGRRLGFGDLTGLDWAMLGTSAAGALGEYMETRADRKLRERMYEEEREDERRRARNMGSAYAGAVRGY